jgi:hypothetical protein
MADGERKMEVGRLQMGDRRLKIAKNAEKLTH